MTQLALRAAGDWDRRCHRVRSMFVVPCMNVAYRYHWHNAPKVLAAFPLFPLRIAVTAPDHTPDSKPFSARSDFTYNGIKLFEMRSIFRGVEAGLKIEAMRSRARRQLASQVMHLSRDGGLWRWPF